MKAISLFLFLILPFSFSPVPLQDEDQDDFLNQLKEKAQTESFDQWDQELSNVFSKTSQLNIYDRLLSEIDSKINNAATFGRISQLLNPSDPTLTGKSYNEFLLERSV